jgi:hypothetical protein
MYQGFFQFFTLPSSSVSYLRILDSSAIIDFHYFWELIKSESMKQKGALAQAGSSPPSFKESIFSDKDVKQGRYTTVVPIRINICE